MQPENHTSTPSVPSWLGSVVVHLFFLLLLLLTFKAAPIKQIRGDRVTEPVGIVLRTGTGENSSGGGGGGAGGLYTDRHNTRYTVEGNVATISPADVTDAVQEISRLSGSVFTPQDALRPLAASTTGSGDGIGNGSGGGIGDGVGPGSGFGDGGSKIGVFRTRAKGSASHFAFVFDVSASMREPDMRPIRESQEALLAALDAMDETQKFSIILFNDRPEVYGLANYNTGVFGATDAQLAMAKGYVRGKLPSGGTNHYRALEAGIKLKPDAIFYLTDGAEESVLTPGQLQEIVQLAKGIQINVIQFGAGVKEPAMNFLKQLADQTGGQFDYVSVHQFPKR